MSNKKQEKRTKFNGKNVWTAAIWMERLILEVNATKPLHYILETDQYYDNRIYVT
jgi:UDP-N-acetylglucosamine pyrophosphorylase